MVAQLVEQGVSRAEAERRAAERPDECRRQLEYLPHAEVKSTPGAYLAAQARQQRERKRQEEVQRKQAREAVQEAQRAAQDAQVGGGDWGLTRLENEDPEAFAAFLVFVEQQKAEAAAPYERLGPTVRKRALAVYGTSEKRRELFVLWRAQGGGGD